MRCLRSRRNEEKDQKLGRGAENLVLTSNLVGVRCRAVRTKRNFAALTISGYGGLIAYQRTSACERFDLTEMPSASFFLNRSSYWFRKRSNIYLFFHFKDIPVWVKGN